MLNDIRFTTQIRPEEMEEILAGEESGKSSSDKPADDLETLNSVEVSRKPIDTTKPFRPSLRPVIAQLLVYYDDQRHFDSVRLTSSRTVIGRNVGDVQIDYDPMLSSQHAEIVRETDADGCRWILRDLGSTNGVFVCVDRARLKDGDEMLLGSERYGFYVRDGDASLRLLGDKKRSQQIQLPADGFCVGREQSDMFEPFWDERLDLKHAFFQPDKTGSWTVKNLQSVNGIWFRIKELPLFRKCYFQLGEQRFGFRW